MNNEILTYKTEDSKIKIETEIAKNHFAEDKLNIQNRIVTSYLEVEEIQALNQVPMYMND
jgi:hypothetical protein